jgi:hypothetical protein
MVELVLFSIQYSTYNDSVRDFFVKFSKHAIEQTDNVLRYIKIKGWLDIAPMLPNTSTKTGEQLGCIEAFHLWAHASYRYTNYEQTLRWREFVHDLDFKTILNQGVKLLDKQLVILERELEEFGISIPKRPPQIIKKNQDKSAFHDDYIFESLFIGLQWAGVLHAQAFKHCVTNDRIRILFKKFLYDEMDLVSHMIKYGKLKGWLETPPLYSG